MNLGPTEAKWTPTLTVLLALLQGQVENGRSVSSAPLYYAPGNFQVG